MPIYIYLHEHVLWARLDSALRVGTESLAVPVTSVNRRRQPRLVHNNNYNNNNNNKFIYSVVVTPPSDDTRQYVRGRVGLGTTTFGVGSLTITVIVCACVKSRKRY